MTSQRRLGVAIALGVLAMVVFASSRTRREAPRVLAPLTHPGELPRDPLAYVPASTRVLVVAELRHLRDAPVSARWFGDGRSGADERCEATLARRMRRVVLALPRLPVDDFAVAAVGDVTLADIERCVSGSEGITREGVPLRVVRSRRSGDAGAASGMLVWTPSGVVLVGSEARVEAMLSRGFDALHGRAAGLRLDGLRGRVREGAAVWALALPGDGESAPDDPIASVTGGVLSVMAGEALVFDAALLCEDGAHARRVQAALTRARDGLLDEVTAAPVRMFLSGARAETDGPEVKVTASVDATTVAGVVDGVTELIRGLAPRAP